MKNINLLPPELQYSFFKRIIYYQQAHQKQFALAGFGILAGIALVGNISQSILTDGYLKKTKIAETEVYQLQAKLKEAQGIMNQLSGAKQVLEFQSMLLNSRFNFLKMQDNFGHHWAAILKELANSVPKGVWLVSFKTEANTLKIAGGAFDENLVSDFMAELRKSPMFSNVAFIYTQDSRVGKTKVVLFELVCNYAMEAQGTQ